MLQYVADNADQFKTQFGNISAASAGAIQRNLLVLESQGGDKFFGEPALNLEDLIQTQGSKGMVNILAADKLMQKSPKVYATFLLWMLSELFEKLPAIGDPEKPKLVFFFDEAHLLFAKLAGRSLAEFWEESSAATTGNDSVAVLVPSTESEQVVGTSASTIRNRRIRYPYPAI